MKKLLLTGLALATLSTASFADSLGLYETSKYNFAKKGIDLDKVIKHSKDKMKEYDSTASHTFGKYYGKAGTAISLSDTLNIDLASDIPSITEVSGTIGVNKKDIDSAFFSAEAKNYAFPFLWGAYDAQDNLESEAMIQRLMIVSKVKASSFVATKDKVIKGEAFFNEPDTIVSEDDRITDLSAGVGFAYDDVFFTNSFYELTISKGTKIDSEVELSVRTKLADKFNTKLTAMRTNYDNKSYDSLTLGLEYRF